MRFVIGIFVLLCCSSITFGQESTREQKLQKIKENSQQIKQLTEEVLLPDAKDFIEAKKNNFEVFRIMPREEYQDDDLMMIRVAYYSFTAKANGYSNIPEIELTKNNFTVGFAGANYGFIADLKETPLAEVNEKTNEAVFLVGYKPPVNMPEIRSEQAKARNYKVGDVEYKATVPAIVGHTYLLRAITFDRADILVAFKVHRKDSDGSLIIFWKLLEQFAKPSINRSNEVSQKAADAETEEKILSALRANGFYDITVDASTVPLTLRGIVPKGKLVEAMQAALEVHGKPIRNQVSER